MTELTADQPSQHARKKRRKPNRQTIFRALRACDGFVAMAARKLKVPRTTLIDWIKKDEAFQRCLDSQREHIADECESMLLKAIRNGEQWAIELFLRQRCRDRGYGKDAEVGPTANVGQVKILVLPDNGREVQVIQPARIESQEAEDVQSES